MVDSIADITCGGFLFGVKATFSVIGFVISLTIVSYFAYLLFGFNYDGTRRQDKNKTKQADKYKEDFSFEE